MAERYAITLRARIAPLALVAHQRHVEHCVGAGARPAPVRIAHVNERRKVA